ncbi:MAG: tryptophan 7-halogenase [Firmicutes bacterium]|nr:tryptophan 7-halogenase [Bacillota bacterium]
MRTEQAEVVITGAGPSGAVAAALLRRQGHQVLVIERETFPRFSIGESLLPQTMQYLEEAGMLKDVVEAGFQYKNGASFSRGEQRTAFDFRDKFSEGWGTTYQVQRGRFDKVLADAAQRMGAEIRYRHEVRDVSVGTAPSLVVADEQGQEYRVEARLILDASGFARLLPRLLNLERPSRFPVRQAYFTHIQDHIAPDGDFDRAKIRVAVHPEFQDVWYWLIPFSDGRMSIGVVAEPAFLDRYEGDEMTRLRTLVNEDPNLRTLLAQAVWDTPARTLKGYSADVTTLAGPGFALLGNAGEFLDPVFSSGVTIALTSASLAAGCAHRQLTGETVDWNAEYAVPLKRGVDTFRAFVEAWYEGSFQKIIFHPAPPPTIRQMICSILAGYAWDERNPYVSEMPRRLVSLAKVCA